MENNILIAKFIGISVMKGLSEQTGKEYYYYNNAEMQDYEALPDFQSDWNWLMLVVDTCSLKADELNVDSLFMVELWMFVTNDITAVYNSCIDFIKWYNENYERKN